MREIRFRGLRIDGKGWVYGYYWYDNQNKKHKITIDLPDDNFRCYEVHPESVGQFTGLTDKNGKEIYEGDVVKGVLYTTGIELDINKDVRFSGGVFTVEKVYIDKIAKIEIIGNIHDKQGGTN